MGRKRMDEGRRVTLGLKVSESLAAQLDGARGDVTRSAWLEAALREALVTAAPVPAAGKRAAPVRTGRLRASGDVEPAPPPAPSRKRPSASEQCPHRARNRYCSPCGKFIGENGYPA